MALIEIASGSDADRDRLSGMFKNLGMETVSASGIEDAVTVAEKTRPRAVFLAENPEGAPVEVFIREILRVAPLVPVVVCLNERNASRAVELMKEGAFDCVASPWTEGTLRPVVRKALRISGTGLDLSKSPVPPRLSRQNAQNGTKDFYPLLPPSNHHPVSGSPIPPC